MRKVTHPTQGTREVADESLSKWLRAGWREANGGGGKSQRSGGDVETEPDRSGGDVEKVEDSGGDVEKAKKPRRTRKKG